MSKPPQARAAHPQQVHTEWRGNTAHYPVARVQRARQSKYSEDGPDIPRNSDDGEPCRPPWQHAGFPGEYRDGDEERRARESGRRREQERRRVQRVRAGRVDIDDQAASDVEAQCHIERGHEHHRTAKHDPTDGTSTGNRSHELN